MKSKEPCPPRWAEATLRSLLRPSDRESISGDLLEEYRAVRQPRLGRFRATAWYIKQVLSVLFRLMWPGLLALTGLTLLSLKVKALWYPSLVQAPLVSLEDTLVYLWTGYYASRRTGLISTGAIVAGATSFIGFTVLFTSIAIMNPDLLAAPFTKPFILVILSVMMLLALGVGVVAGTLGSAVGKWLAPVASRTVPAS
jgi:hypothetical protein